MRELDVGEFGVLLSLFAVLLLAFSADFHLSRRQVRSHHWSADAFAFVSLLGELSAAITIVLTWAALWSEVAWENISDLWVLIPGSIAVACALLLTVERAFMRSVRIVLAARKRATDDSADGGDGGGFDDGGNHVDGA